MRRAHDLLDAGFQRGGEDGGTSADLSQEPLGLVAADSLKEVERLLSCQPGGASRALTSPSPHPSVREGLLIAAPSTALV